ncbi:MAG: hypothetical protein JWM53_748 [bacterium]|nr:hypothetical protein [bacterium]
MAAITRRRDRGFSLLVVFMLIIVMVGVAATVILSTQQDLSVAGQDRESLQAFYAAEHAVAQAKDFLAGAAAAHGITQASFAAGGGWTAILAQVNAAGATQGCATGPTNATPRMPWSDFSGAGGAFATAAGNVRWRWCIHNNADDVAYLDPGGAAPPGCAGKNGDVCDERDPSHLITIEAWGAFPVDPSTGLPLTGAAQSHLAVNVGNVALQTSTWSER